jgi:hypothetical protein
MRHVTLVAVLACSTPKSAPKSAPIANRAPTVIDRDPWAGVGEGKVFTFDNWHEDKHPNNVAIVVAKVLRVERTGEQRTIHLKWTVDWGGTGAIDVDLYTANNREVPWLPDRVIVTRDRVRFDDRDMEFPLSAAKFPDDGRYVTVENGTTCFGYDKHEILDCDEICVAKICLDHSGIVSGDGEGWPNGEEYVRSRRR